MDSQVRVHLVLVTWNGAAYLQTCLPTVFDQSVIPASIWVVDNNSGDDTLRIVSAYEQRARATGTALTPISLSQNIGFTRGANVGLRAVLDSGRVGEDDLIVLLNQDTSLEADFFASLIAAGEQMPNLGAVGCKIYYPDGTTLQHAGGYLERPRLVGKHYGHHCVDGAEFDTPREVEFVTGAAIGLRVSALREVGLLNELFSPGYYEDVEICSRLRSQGWQVWYWPAARLKHVESASFDDWWARLALSHRNRLLFAMFHTSEADFQALAKAELAFIRAEADFTTCRALSSAYGLVLAFLAAAPASLLKHSDVVLEAISTVSALSDASIERLSICYRMLE